MFFQVVQCNDKTEDDINDNFDLMTTIPISIQVPITDITKKKKLLIETVKNLTKIEYLEIFNIIQNDNCQFSRNANGVFINLQNMNESTIDKIFEFIDFIKHKKEDLIKQEEYMLNIRKNIIETTIDKTQEKFISDKVTTELSYDKKIEYDLSDTDNDYKNSDYLVFSSDEDENIDNKINLKKKKIKYTGKKLKMIKSIKDANNESNNPYNQKKTTIKK